MAVPRFLSKRDNFVVPAGGLDLVTPPLSLAPGAAIDIQNFECDLDAGYARIAGYDKVIDNLTPPDMEFWVGSITTTGYESDRLKPNDFIATQAGLFYYMGPSDPEFRTGPRAYLLRQNTANQGAYFIRAGEPHKAGDLIFRVGDPNSNPVGALNSTVEPLSGETLADQAQLRQNAQALVRGTMLAPGDSFNVFESLAYGPILATVVYRGLAYVFRTRNPLIDGLAPQTATPKVVMLKPKAGTSTTPRGREWEEVPLPVDILASNAKFSFAVHNFTGVADGEKLYFTTSVTKALVYDGTSVTEITTGMVDDTPDIVAVHKNRLWLAFHSSVQFSQAGEPLTWSVVLGAGEIATGEEVTGMLSVGASELTSAMLISVSTKLYMLFGDTANDFEMRPYAPDTGAIRNTLQSLGQRTVVGNAFGLATLAATDQYGGFEEAAFSEAIKPYLDARLNNIVASVVVRSKNQYRLFFDDGTGIYVTFEDGKMIGMTLVRFAHRVTCAWSALKADKSELVVIGTEDGQLFQMDKGSSFAGEPIDFFVRMAFNHLRSPRDFKHFKRTEIEVQPEGYAEFDVGYDLDYAGRRRAVTPVESTFVPNGDLQSFWDQFQWDSFTWDGAEVVPITLDTPGRGSNISIRIQGRNAVSERFTITGVLLDYVPGRKKR